MGLWYDVCLRGCLAGTPSPRVLLLLPSTLLACCLPSPGADMGFRELAGLVPFDSECWDGGAWAFVPPPGYNGKRWNAMKHQITILSHTLASHTYIESRHFHKNAFFSTNLRLKNVSKFWLFSSNTVSSIKTWRTYAFFIVQNVIFCHLVSKVCLLYNTNTNRYSCRNYTIMPKMANYLCMLSSV